MRPEALHVRYIGHNNEQALKGLAVKTKIECDERCPRYWTIRTPASVDYLLGPNIHMLIRQLNLDEAPTLQSLRALVDVAGTLGRPIERHRSLTIEFIEQQLQPPHETIGSFVGENMVGSASMCRMPENPIDAEATDWFGLSSVIVHPDFRGCGVGRALMNDCISRGRKQKAKGMLLVVNVPNPAALALYESFGFETWYINKGIYQHNDQWIDELSMRKLLDVA